MLSNSWMTNINVIAQFAHSGVSYGILLTLGRYHPALVLYAGLGIVAYAAVKEFYYDARFEIPPQSFMNNLTDFIFYNVGVWLAVLVNHF